MTLSLGFSPCPNDCFMFDAIVHRRIDLEGLDFDVVMTDVEALNRVAFTGNIAATKLSYHAFAHCASEYVLLDAGSALGRGCGPLLISRRDIAPAELAGGALRIAIPGRFTTANLLLRLAFPQATNTDEIVFSEIEAGVLNGDYDAGVIIHENRFTYEAKGLRRIVDLGEFWETSTGMPIPLGGIVVKRSLPDDVRAKMNRVMRRSVEYAFANPAASGPFVREHAQEMSDDVMRRHIELYVNEFSIDLGADGRRAVEVLFERAAAAGLVPPLRHELFVTPPPTRPESAGSVRRHP
jgi:1,4-dihydroxy-6-naphthoate synthase